MLENKTLVPTKSKSISVYLVFRNKLQLLCYIINARCILPCLNKDDDDDDEGQI